MRKERYSGECSRSFYIGENVTEEEGFIHALKLADEFWNIYIKHAIAEVEAIEIIIKKTNKTDKNYAIFDKELPLTAESMIFRAKSSA